MYVIHANLDCEARWAGGSLPAAVAARVSYYAALTSAFSDDDVEVWAPAAIDTARLRASPSWRPPAMRVGIPPRADLAWAYDAKAANDRRLAHTLARELAASGVAMLPNIAIVDSLDALVAWSSSTPGRWVAKAPWTTAGRDRCHGEGAPTDEQRTYLARLFARFGSLVVEPWAERLFDVGLCGRIRTVADDPTARMIQLDPPHGLITDARGTFLGIDLAPPPLSIEESTHLTAAARRVGEQLIELGHRGAFAIDAFVYRSAGERRLHALCEINARTTFGHVARAFGRRGATRLGFGAPPPDATVLVEPATDGVTAWIA